MTSTPRKHHVVPKVYLKNFARDNKLYVLSKKTGRCFSASLNKVSVITDYYSYKNEDGTTNFQIEKALSLIESNSADVFYNIINRNNINHEQKKVLSIFLGILFSRVSNHRNALEKSLEKMVHKTGQMLLARTKNLRDIFDDEYDNLLSYFGSDEGIRSFFIEKTKVEVFNVASLPYIHLGLKISELLFEMHWRFWTCDDNKGYFVTSNNPCYVTNRNMDKSPYGAGIAYKNSRFNFPVSPNIFLIADWHGHAIDYKPINKQILNRVNARTIRYAESEIYADKMTNSMLNMFEKNRLYSLEALVDSLGPYLIARKKIIKKIPS